MRNNRPLDHKSRTISRIATVLLLTFLFIGGAFTFLSHLPVAQAAPVSLPLAIITGTSVVTHTGSTSMTVFNDGTLTDQFLVDNGDDQIGDNNSPGRVPHTTIAIRFGEHDSPNEVDVGLQGEFSAIGPITLDTTSAVSGFSEVSQAIYEAEPWADYSYQVTQRTLIPDTANNCALVELIIENTGPNALNNGKVLFLVDIDAGQVMRGDTGRFTSTHQVVYQTDYNPDNTTGYGVGIKLFQDDPLGYGIAKENTSDFLDPQNDNSLKVELTDPLYQLGDPVPTIEAPNDNMVSWLVAEIADALQYGETKTLVFGLCAASATSVGDDPSMEDKARGDMIDDFSNVTPVELPPAHFSESNYDVDEDSGTVTIDVSLDYPFARPIAVDYTTFSNNGNNAATAGVDYLTRTDTLNFPPLTTQQSFTVPIVNDTNIEDDEVFNLSLSAPVNNDTATVTIREDDGPTVSITDAEPVNEADGIAQFTVTLSESINRAITVEYTLIEDPAHSNSNDYSQNTGSPFSFKKGQTTRQIVVDIHDDDDVEGDQTFYVRLHSPVRATIGFSQATGLIIDDDFPTVSIGNAALVTETVNDPINARFPVTLSEPYPQTVTVEYHSIDGTARSALGDYVAVDDVITFPPLSTNQMISVPILDDDIDEYQEYFFVELENPSRAILTGSSQGEATIGDNDPEPTIGLSNTVLRHEGDENEQTPAVFTATLSHTSGKTVTVDFLTEPEPPTLPGVDYEDVMGTLVFTPNILSQNISVVILGDTEIEENEIFVVKLNNPVNVSISDNEATGVIINDDNDGGVPTISIFNAGSVVESATAPVQAEFPVILSQPSPQPVTVEYYTTDDTAQSSPEDYEAADTTVTFPPMSTIEYISIPILDDDLDEYPEKFYVTLKNPSSNASLSNQTQAEAIIQDNDPEPIISITDAANVSEENANNVNAVFPVRLSQISGKTVTVEYETENESADAGEDYTSKSGSVTFAPYSSTATIDVDILDDTEHSEGNESFLVRLSNSTNGQLGNDRAGRGTIEDDDTPPPPQATTLYLPVVFKSEPPSSSPPCHLETFDNTSSGWAITSGPPTLLEYFNGKYHMLTQDASVAHWAESPLGVFNNYLVQVEANWIDSFNDHDEYSIVFDLQDASNMYRFSVNPNTGQYRLRMLHSDIPTDLIPPTPSTDILGGPNVNVLKVERDGDEIKLYINNKHQDTYVDNTFPSGKVGVNIVPDPFNGINGNAYFDNFFICSDDLDNLSATDTTPGVSGISLQ